MKRYITILLLWCLLQGVGGQGWTVHLPQKVKGLEGSCVRIPVTSTWVMAGIITWTVHVQPNGFRGPKPRPGTAGGESPEQGLHHIFHNLTTSQSSLKYYFKLDCNILKYRFATGIDITVKAVWKPVLSRVGEAEVQEGSPVTLSCSTLITCPLLPPTLSWRPSLGEAQKEVGAKNVTTVLTFNASYIHHGERIFCSSLYKREAGHNPPRNVSVEWPSGPVLEGSYVRLNCSCSANPPRGTATPGTAPRLHPGPDQGPDQGPLGFNQSFTALVSEDTQFYCEVRNPYGVQNSSLTQMDVHCDGHPGRVLEGSYVRSELQLLRQPPRGQLHLSFTALVSEDTQFYCEVRNPYGVQNSSLTRWDVHFPPKEVELRVEPPVQCWKALAFTLSCSSRAQPLSPATHGTGSSGGGHWGPGPLPGPRSQLTVERAMQTPWRTVLLPRQNHLGGGRSRHQSTWTSTAAVWRPLLLREPGEPCAIAGLAIGWRSCQSLCTLANHGVSNRPLGIISVISLNQSDEDPPTLVCLSNNSVGIDRMELNLAFSKGSVVMTLLCALFHVTLAGKAGVASGGNAPEHSTALPPCRQLTHLLITNKLTL
ncbi:hypothetical protein N1851_013153 [Merluccius polli]|uniref:Ig-like domain-containing protein n=1 Tax=Merluccius polli TaxID=89951 RepID=A0AA47P3V3_MERPO|nr:hypothetical protein N1851_013153 [Merluccius polli]